MWTGTLCKHVMLNKIINCKICYYLVLLVLLLLYILLVYQSMVDVFNNINVNRYVNPVCKQFE